MIQSKEGMSMFYSPFPKFLYIINLFIENVFFLILMKEENKLVLTSITKSEFPINAQPSSNKT